jgi:hypothetical protein
VGEGEQCGLPCVGFRVRVPPLEVPAAPTKGPVV